jgi:hypothetical protein
VRPPDAYASRRLERGRLRYEQGHKSELLYWLNWCLINDVQVPQWVKEGLNKAWIAAVSYRIKSWDQVFDRPVPKGTWLATKRQNQKIALDVFSRVCDLHASDPPRVADWRKAI